MNPNDNDDAKLIAQIDRRIQDDQPSGIPLVDDLAAAIPQPRPDFQQQLEDSLAAHYHLPQNGKGELELVTHTPILDNRPQKKWAFIPLTLAAAMLAVVIIGSIISSPNRGGSQGGLAVGLQTTLSPTPVGTVLPNPAPVTGCDTPNATLVVPINGMVIFEPINVIGTAFTDNFGFYRFELNGPSTSGNFAMIRDYDQPVETLGELGQFVPSFYEPGEYEFRLVVFATDNSLRAACTINITISEPIPTPTPINPRADAFFTLPASTDSNPSELDSLRKTVIALQDIPSGTQITAGMVTVAYFEKDSISDRAYYNSSLVEGRFAAQDINSMQPITLDDISDAPLPQADLIPTLTPAQFVNVVIALQDLPRGYKFPATIDELTGVVGYYPWPELVVAPGMLREDQQGLERLLGQELSSDAFREQALISNLFVGGLGENVPMYRSFLPGVAVPNDPLVNVVVPLQDLPRGYQFPTDIADLDNIVDYMTLPESAISLDALREDQNGLQQLLGRILKTDVYRQQPILQNLLADDLIQLANIGNMTNFGIPSGQVSISLPVSISEIIASGIRERDTVDLVVSMLYTNLNETYQTVQPPDGVITLNPQDGSPPCPTDEPCSTTQTVVQNAMILNIRPSTEGDTNMLVTLIVSPPDMPIINWILEAKLPYILRRTIPESVQLPSHPGIIPTGMWLSEITFDQISGDISPIQQGDLVDISFSFLWQEVEPELSNTISPENGRVFTVPILNGVKVYKLGESIGGDKNDMVTLLLSEEDMALLSSLLKTTVPFAITLTQSNQPGLFAPYITNDQLVLQIPASSLTNTESLSALSNTVNILAQVDFNGYDPTNPNSFQLQGHNLVAQVVARDAQITSDRENSYSVTVTLDDLPRLQWALKAGLPLTVQLLAN